jgi:hypothetical protein
MVEARCRALQGGKGKRIASRRETLAPGAANESVQQTAGLENRFFGYLLRTLAVLGQVFGLVTLLFF